MAEGVRMKRKTKQSDSDDNNEEIKCSPVVDRRERRRALKRKRASTIMAIVKCLLKDGHFDLDCSLSDDDIQTTSESDGFEAGDMSERKLSQEIHSLKKRVRDLEHTNQDLKEELQSVKDLNKAVKKLEVIAERFSDISAPNTNYHHQQYFPPMNPNDFLMPVGSTPPNMPVPFPTIKAVSSMNMKNDDDDLMELVPDTGVLLSASQYKKARASPSGKIFARTLLTYLFDQETLLNSTVRGVPPKGRGKEKTPFGRPALDQDIINAIIDRTIKEYPDCSSRDVLSALGCKLVEMRRKEKDLTNDKYTLETE